MKINNIKSKVMFCSLLLLFILYTLLIFSIGASCGSAKNESTNQSHPETIDININFNNLDSITESIHSIIELVNESSNEFAK